MQRGLIDDGAGHERIAVLFERDGQAPEPVGPLGSQMPLDPDLIGHRRIPIRCCIAFIYHRPHLSWPIVTIRGTRSFYAVATRICSPSLIATLADAATVAGALNPLTISHIPMNASHRPAGI